MLMLLGSLHLCTDGRVRVRRVFEIDMEHCPNGGGELKIIAAILEAPVSACILEHLGLSARLLPPG
jgi:hypothetical protein